MTNHVITANGLKDGLVVFQSADDSWTPSIGAAEIIEGDDRLESCLARAQNAEVNRLVVGPYAIDVAGDGPRPVKYRERIRAFGPSTHPEFSHDVDTSNSEVSR